ncbi:fatty acyl-AMP ligase [Mycobacterium hubeiense]|uniref:fatty acyl-AMP ligase n=1 Tax=Mycobacterium hubeiense TaxID=1867256 RepID=UPI00130473BE|nr:fatty acyl-AMP ligase [Mycobacterium sp. QGD 101]
MSARASCEALAYVFLADGTSASELRWTFADVADNSRRFAALLRDNGVDGGDRVLLAVNPSLEYIAALYGIMQLGAVPVPCFPPLRPKELDRFEAITLDCRPRAIVIDAMYDGQMAALKNRPAFARLDLVTVYTDGAPSTQAAEANSDPPGRDALALIQYTSGSTGSPKGVCLTHDNVVSNCEALGRSMGHDPDRVGLSWLPPYHDMGLMGTIILSMYHGWPLVLMSPMHFVQQPLRWLQAIDDYGVSITVGPNFSLALCAEALCDEAVGELDLSTVRQWYCGAEPISADTLALFQRATEPFGFDMRALIPCYGMAEATLFVSGKRAGARYRTDHTPDQSGRTVVSCGDVDAAHTVRIVDPQTLTRLDDGVVGEIWVAGRSVAAGYYNKPELTRETFRARLVGDDDDYLRTGDLGFLRSGELYVTGRLKDLIIVNGRNIYPHDVEAAVVAADRSLRTAVAFSLDEDDIERLCVVAEVGDHDVTAGALSAVRESIRVTVTSEFGVAPDILLCPRRAIPTTTSGKVRRQEARRMLVADELPLIEAKQECTA